MAFPVLAENTHIFRVSRESPDLPGPQSPSVQKGKLVLSSACYGREMKLCQRSPQHRT